MIRSLSYLLIVPLLLVASTSGAASPTVPDTLAPGLRVLSWNIYMLPKFAKITGKRQRAALIAAKLHAAQYDVLVFQEAFLEDARRIIWAGLKDQFPYQYGPANERFSIKTNSGIWVLSKLQLTVLEEIDFGECEGFDDCFARKGALLLEGKSRRWSEPFQILGTHLQAGGPHSIRQSQMDEMRNLLDRHRRAGVPQIICGDMNTAQSDTAHYADMLRRLAAEDGPLDIRLTFTDRCYPNDLHHDGVRDFRIIDYVFLRPNGHRSVAAERRMYNFQSQWSPQHKDLSDHFPIGAEIWW